MIIGLLNDVTRPQVHIQPLTLSLNRKLYEQYSGIIWGLILIQTYIDKLRKAKKVNKKFKVFEQKWIFEPPTI